MKIKMKNVAQRVLNIRINNTSASHNDKHADNNNNDANIAA